MVSCMISHAQLHASRQGSRRQGGLGWGAVVTTLTLVCLLSCGSSVVQAAEVRFHVRNPPPDGRIMALLFNSANSFVDLRDAFRALTLAATEEPRGVFDGLPSGDYALVVFADENGNGMLDKNFARIPREPLGFSRGYWPEGPPSFSRAVLHLEGEESRSSDIELRSILGSRGLVGLGLGLLGHSSPYRDADDVSLRIIPAVSYMGDRLQVMGPSARFGLAQWQDMGLALTASYRFAAYEEDDSPLLQGLGDRDDTLAGGLALRVNLPAGLRLSAGYEHDLLQRSDGGEAQLGLEKALQWQWLTLTPQLTLHWLTPALAAYDFGVPAERARPDRAAYEPGSAINPEFSLNLFVELAGSWRIMCTGGVLLLSPELSDSPLVDETLVFRSFVAIHRLF